MTETKASRIKELSNVVSVPDFQIVRRGDALNKNYDNSKEYMVRSSACIEDNERYSHAGQFDTFGPVEVKYIPEHIEKIFQNPMVSEVVVQEYARDLVKGVAFCFDEKDIYLEYSKIREGVTSGKVNPFVAVLPSKISKYDLIHSEISRIYKKFGPSDIEFCGIEKPLFLQVRPITCKFQIDRGLTELKMNLQELHEDRWVENDLCKVLPEKRASGEYIKAYVEALRRVFLSCFGRKADISERDIIKISSQFFMARKFEESIRPTIWELTKFGFGFMKIFSEIKGDYERGCDAVRLFENSIKLSYGYDILKRDNIFKWREKYREKIEEIMSGEESKEAGFQTSRKLREYIEKDSSQMIWRSIGYHDGDGIEVVSGDFRSGPFFHLIDEKQQIPEDVILVTKQLFPNIGRGIRKLKGIVCENGSMNSHIAILAREFSIPLKIQVSDIGKYK